MSQDKIPATLLRGDGIGPEIIDATLAVLDKLNAPFEFDQQLAGMEAYDKTGDPLPEQTIESIRKNKLALKAPLTTPIGGGFRSINVRLRQEFKLFANIRPARTFLEDGMFKGIDIVLVRENLEGMYVGFEHFVPVGDDPKGVAESSSFNTRIGCQNIARYTYDYAVAHNRKKVTIVHKANILKALTGLFLETAREIGKEYEGKVITDDRIVDNTAMQLVVNPQQFDVIVTTNMFGDILSDEISGLVGGLGLTPGANKGKDVAIFEAVHGSAPDIAGQGIANPTALMLSAGMLLDHVGETEKAERIQNTIHHVLNKENVRTRDLGGTASTQEYTAAILSNL